MKLKNLKPRQIFRCNGVIGMVVSDLLGRPGTYMEWDTGRLCSLDGNVDVELFENVTPVLEACASLDDDDCVPHVY